MAISSLSGSSYSGVLCNLLAHSCSKWHRLNRSFNNYDNNNNKTISMPYFTYITALIVLCYSV